MSLKFLQEYQRYYCQDFIRYRLTGEFYSEMSDASGTSMLNVGERKWSEEILAAMGWLKAWLPELTESTVASAKVSPDASERTGLAVDTPVIAGGGGSGSSGSRVWNCS